MNQNYKYNSISYAKELKYVKVPKFQRSLVWSKQKKLDLLKTLHKDFPFGALLVASDGDQGYRLLDGQQRLSTIRDFEQHKLYYWKELNKARYHEMFDELNQMLKDHQIAQINYSKLNQLLDANYDTAEWTDELPAQPVDNPDKHFKRNIRHLISDFRHEIDGYIDLSSLLIPVIEFLGSEADLPEVYENLNRGGVPLTKYEVLNASWSDENIKMPADFALGDQILDYVKQYYNQLRNNGAFELENFSEDDITNTRTINLAEFARALGNLVVEQLPSLMTPSTKVVNEMGFGLLGIITGTDNKKIATIHNQSDQIQDRVEAIVTQSDSLAKKINARFERILKQNIAFGNHTKAKQNQYVNGLTTTFKVLSYFASLWNRDEAYIKKSLDNIPAYYVYDYITKAWNAHGDQRLYEYYQKNDNRNYYRQLDSAEFKSSFNNWIADNPGIRKTFSKEIKALITIHSNLTYLAGGLPASEDYEFEHVIPKARILKNDPGPRVVWVSNLGNGMFLPKSLNNSKSSKTLYEFNRDLDTVDYQTLRKESNYFSHTDFQTIFDDLDRQSFAAVNAKIKMRAEAMAAQIIAGLNPANEFFHQISPRHSQNRLTHY